VDFGFKRIILKKLQSRFNPLNLKLHQRDHLRMCFEAILRIELRRDFHQLRELQTYSGLLILLKWLFLLLQRDLKFPYSDPNRFRLKMCLHYLAEFLTFCNILN
jgi:hypothetical protein